jgi:cell division topological specificity factor
MGGWLDRIFPQRNTAAVAKERLQILVAHERAQLGRKPSYLPQLREELLAVIRKYVKVAPEDVTFNIEQDADREVLELNIVLQDQDK